jgi:hypothetical protein
MLKRLKEKFSSILRKYFVSWNTLSGNRIIRYAAYTSIACWIISMIVIFVFWGKLPPQVPLWYSRPWGLERLAHPGWLFLLFGSGILFTIINIIITAHVLMEHLVFSQLLFLTSLFVSVLSLITLVEIMYLVL